MDESFLIKIKNFIESQSPFLGYLIVVILPSAIVILLLNLFAAENNTYSSAEEANQYSLAGNYERAENKYRELLQVNPENIEYHRAYIQNHFIQPKTKGKNNYRDDDQIINYYKSLLNNNNSNLNDLSNYSLGLIESHLNNYQKAITFFSNIKNIRLPYYNNSYGYCLWKIGNVKEAEEFFEREIMYGKNIDGAVANLVALSVEQKKYERIKSLLVKTELKKYVPYYAQRLTFLSGQEYLTYIQQIIEQIFSNITIDGFIAGLIILSIWFFYFVYIDIFEREQLRALLLTLGLGMLSAVLCTILYDNVEFNLNFRMNRIWYNDLAYCVFIVGIIEETVKILPVLILFRFSKLLNEPIDFIIYASVSALGFAFMENMLYFNPSGIHLITGRAFTSVIAHIVLSSIAAYGLLIGTGKADSFSKWIIFGISFSIACIVHGLYDFFLSGSGSWDQLAPFAILLLIYSITIFGKMINNALNKSTFYSEQDIPKLHNLGRFLAYALSYIILLQYIITVARYGVNNANLGILKSMLGCYGLIVVLTFSLGRFKLQKNKVLPLFKTKG